MHGKFRQSNPCLQRVPTINKIHCWDLVGMSTKAKTRKVKNPRLLAYGEKAEYGDIHYPALPCADPARTPQPQEDYISKSMSRAHARREIQQTSAWRRRNFDFALVPEDYCEGEGTLREGKGKNRKSIMIPRYLLFSKYGGKTARDTTREMVYQAKRIIQYLDALIELREKVAEMNKENFYHNDITDLNITYDEEKRKAFLIDFEYADRSPPRTPSPKSNNSPINIDLSDETYFINRTIDFLLDELKEAGITIPMKQSSPRSSRSRSSRTRKIIRPHSI
jgi:hypothetical protein